MLQGVGGDSDMAADEPEEEDAGLVFLRRRYTLANCERNQDIDK